MAKYLIKWNYGFGEMAEVYDFDSLEEAIEAAESACREEMESSMDFDAELLNQDNAENYGYEDELED